MAEKSPGLAKDIILKMQGNRQIPNRINPKKSYQKIYSPTKKMEGQRKNILKIAIEKEYLFSREDNLNESEIIFRNQCSQCFLSGERKKNYQTRILIYEILFNEENSIHLRLKQQQQEFAAKRANKKND